jgi:NADH:ubiquinone oxidoreductase subunit F (NADH-binding)
LDPSSPSEPIRNPQSAIRNDKYVICNCDEGDPGAFMDRMLLESYPFRVIEGVAIAAYAVGASQAIFYIRAEYPLAVQRVQAALDACRGRKLIGPGAMDGAFDLDIRIMQGAGAFVCGEETALIASLEGRRGMPRLRPPYPATSGLWGRPTLVNNTETCALVPWIIRNGSQAFAALGTKTSKGTKVFALAGKVARGGLIEVPMGVSLRQIVEEVGGGCAGGKRFKAAQVGGPSGGCVPAELADIPVDYEALVAAGAMMGSGGLVILDEDDCIVEIARYFLEFTQDQSCGRCTFCRIGTRRMLDILERICRGEGKPSDLEQLETLARQVQQGSLCGLGKTAPNPVLSTLKYFRPEYEAHIAGRCPAGKCKAMIRYVITEKCIGCTVCAQHCPADAISMRPYERHEIDQDKCIRCNTCKSVCPQEAVKVE